MNNNENIFFNARGNNSNQPNTRGIARRAFNRTSKYVTNAYKKVPSQKMIMEEILPDVLDASVILTKMYKGITPTDVEFSKLLKYGSKWPNKMAPKENKPDMSELEELKIRLEKIEAALIQHKILNPHRNKRNKV